MALHSASLKACFINVVQSEVRWGSCVRGGEGRGGGDALCSWFKVGWSRNNGHEKNMARSGPLPLLWKARCPKWCMRKWIETFVMILWKLYFYVSTSGLSRRVGFFLPDIRRRQRLDSRARISSSCALCDTYEPIKAERAVFERVGEVKSRVSLTANCSH